MAETPAIPDAPNFMQSIAVPIDLSAFVLSPECAAAGSTSRIAPITQPNYIGLRLDEALMRHDLVDHIDFHQTVPAASNTRISDISANPTQLRRNRLGVYLHWSLPRAYRSGRASSENVPGARSMQEVDDSTVPIFPVVPNRWLIVRRLTNQKSEDNVVLPEYQSWIVESNRVRKVQDIPDDVDLEVDVSPFIAEGKAADAATILDNQAEIFVGKRTEYAGWGPGVRPAWKEEQNPVPPGFTRSDPNFIDMTVMGSSNPLFPDYVPHNGGSFSIIDSFRYDVEQTVAGKKQVSEKHLTEADADYFVIGWHSLYEHDLLGSGKRRALRTRLDEMKYTINVDGIEDPELKPWIQAMLNNTPPTETVLHGSIYSVKYRLNSKPRSLADEAGAKFTPEFKMEPLSMGTTALDAVITFLEAHKPEDLETVFGTGTGDIATQIISLLELRYASDDSYNERVKAQDLFLHPSHFAKSQAPGSFWNYSARADTGKQPKTPSETEMKELKSLNEDQARFDVTTRKLRTRRWLLWAQWWTYVADKTNIDDKKQPKYIQNVKDLSAEIKILESTIATLQAQIKDKSTDKPYRRNNQPAYYVRKDPTLCIAGIDSGWPADFMDNVVVRAEQQIASPENTILRDIFDGGVGPFPPPIREIANRLLVECTNGGPQANRTFQSRKGFQDWGNANPFMPMFIEWEAYYYHIARDKWTVGVRPSPTGHAHSQVRYGVNEMLAKPPKPDQPNPNQQDFRIVSGRTLILPQPVFSVETAVLDVLDKGDPNMTLSADVVKKIKDNVRKLKFISSPLAGLTEHLLTRCMGTHVKPLLNHVGKSPIPLGAAETRSKDIGFNSEILSLIGSATETTPYGNLLAFPKDSYPGVPFKGVTHGQLMLTKLNLIDKFGQAIALPEPKPKLRPSKINRSDPPASVHPCLSDWISPDYLVDEVTQVRRLNTVYPEPDRDPNSKWPLTRFAQLTPAINQDARINASFMTPTGSNSFPFWRETLSDKPESPVFGWIVINYQDSGLQFFRPDGTFYREVRVGGQDGTNLGSKWLPFDPPADAKSTGNVQLDNLISKISDKGDTTGRYLKSFFHMINGAIKTMPFPPSDYASYANALVGKPLALVNVGWSLELAVPALKAQNTLGNTPPGSNEEAELSSYEFPFKIGDSERPFDGVVGYFETDNMTTGKTGWDTMYTYFPDPDNSRAFTQITPANFPTLSPTYIDPISFKSSTMPNSFSSYIQAREAQYFITTLLIDPYTPLHAYSPILPIKELALPPWTIEQAFTRMTAFFRLGPSLISRDVPAAYDPKRPLAPDSWATKRDPKDPTAVLPAIRLPISGKKGLWRWLQPYDVKSDVKDAPNLTRFNEMDVNEEDTKIRKEAAPYTFVEGYLQLARPLLTEEVKVAGT